VNYSAQGSLIIRNSRFLDNGNYGAVRSAGPMTIVEGCEFRGNVGFLFGGGIMFQGPGRLTDCTFIDNHAVPYMSNELTQGGGIMAIAAGGSEGSVLEFEGNYFEGNTCTDYGAAIHVSSNYETYVRNNVFVNNTADACGAGVYVIGVKDYIVEIDDNMFIGNHSARGVGVGIDVCEDVKVRGNTIVNSVGGAGIRVESSTGVVLERNIVAYGRLGILWSGSTGTQTCNNAFMNQLSDYSGNVIGATNISVDPMFCDLEGMDLGLKTESPCLPANNTCGVQIGMKGEGCPQTLHP